MIRGGKKVRKLIIPSLTMQWMRLCDGGHESSAFPMTTSFATPSAIAIFFTEKQGALSLSLSLSLPSCFLLSNTKRKKRS